MDYRACFDYLVKRRTQEIVITSAGTSSQMWHDLTHSFDRVFYLDASMSLVSMFGAGIALGLPETPIWAFSGDGAVSMNPGMFMVENELKTHLRNVTHFIVSNRVYGATSEVPLPNASSNDYADMAKSMGIKRAYSFTKLGELQEEFENLVSSGEYTVVVLEVDPIGTPLPGVHIEPAELKYRFGRSIEANTGIRVFDSPD